LVTVLAGLAGLLSLRAEQQVNRGLRDLTQRVAAHENGENRPTVETISRDLTQLAHQQQTAVTILLVTMLVLGGAAAAAGIVVARAISNPVAVLNHAAARMAGREEDTDFNPGPQDDLNQLAFSLKTIGTELERTTAALCSQEWQHEAITKLIEVMNHPDAELVADELIAEVCTTLNAPVGALYVTHPHPDDPTLERFGSYGYSIDQDFGKNFRVGEALVGQAARQKRRVIIKNAPKDYVKITSGLGTSLPRYICLNPLLRKDEVTGVIELGLLADLSEEQKTYLDQAAPTVAVAVQSIRDRRDLTRQLRDSEDFVRKLAAEQQKLFAVNAELRQQMAVRQVQSQRRKG
jgi:hypothetical protein